jgi:predicted nucleotidyltransferase
MIDISAWMDQLLKELHIAFGQRLWFVALQGSYGRGEATEHSDIDAVVILDTLSASDLQLYNTLLDRMPHRELSCGFISGKEELLHWEPSDLLQLYYDTTPVYGSMDAVLPLLDRGAVDRAIKIGACNLYHGCVHNMLHGKSENTLKGLYKGASFVIQAICLRQTGRYCRHLEELAEAVAPAEQKILRIFMKLKAGSVVAFTEMSEILFAWCQKWITEGEYE